MTSFRCFMTTTALALTMAGSAANAAPIVLFNTGVDSTGVPRPNYMSETHYTLASNPGPLPINYLRTATSANGFPIPPWTGDNSVSSWIGPENATIQGPAGNYVYRTTFSLAGLNPATASISGRWAADDYAADVVLNGVGTGQIGGSFAGWAGFSLNSGFVAGLNTLDFLVGNAGGPTGLRVEMTGSADAVPEPASWAMLIAGFGLTGAAMRRRARTKAASPVIGAIV